MTDTVYLTGKAKFCRVHMPDQYNKYQTTLYMDQANVDKFMEMKVKNTLRKDEDGYHVKFGCPTSKEIRGKVVGFAPPMVIDTEGKPMLGIPVGDGSDITIKLQHYGYTPPGKKNKEFACRLESVRVNNLVPYTTASMDVDQQRQVKDILNQPIPEEIPF